MRKLAATLLVALLCLNCYAQRKQIDSLKKEIIDPKDDTSRIKSIYRLAIVFARSKPDSALILSLQAEQLSKAAGFLRGEIKALNIQGEAFNYLGNYPKALNRLFAGLKLAESTGYNQYVDGLLSDIGYVYANDGDYRQDIYYNHRALLLARARHNEHSESVQLLNIGDDYEKLNILDSAEAYGRQALQKILRLHDFKNAGIALGNIGNIYVKLNNTDSALYYYRLAIPVLKKSNDDEGLCEATLGMATVFRRLRMQDSSLYYASQSISAGWHGGFTDKVLDASKFLTAYFKQQGRPDSALRYLEVSVAAKDSLFSQERTREFQNIGFAERQRQQEIQEKEIAYKTSVRYYLLLATIAFLVVIAIIFWRNSKQREKANTLLQSQNIEIEKQKKSVEDTLGELKTTQAQLVQSAKMASLGELTAGIAHEIQNPLNFVNNFSEINEEMLGDLKEALKNGQTEDALAIANDLEENEKKVRHHGKRADFIVKGMLEHSRVNTGEKRITDVNVLADEFLKLSYHGLRAKDKNFNSELATNFDTSLPRINIAQQDIGRVLLNLYNNAFYAVNQKVKTAANGYKPTVEVSTFHQNGSIMIRVKDNGTGVPGSIKDKIMQPFFTTKPTGEGTGLGLSLSYDIVVKGHGGKISVDSKEGEGSEFTVTLPVN